MNELSDPMFRVLLVGALLALPLKVMCLWKSAQNNQKGWFAAVLLLNTLGILELTYLFYFSKPKTDDKDTSN